MSVLLVATVLGGASDSLCCYARIGESLQAYRQSYRALDREGVQLNSLDRLILSFVIAGSKTRESSTPKNKQDVQPVGHTS